MREEELSWIWSYRPDLADKILELDLLEDFDNESNYKGGDKKLEDMLMSKVGGRRELLQKTVKYMRFSIDELKNTYNLRDMQLVDVIATKSCCK